MKNEHIHILLIEDSRTHAELIREAFVSHSDRFILTDAPTLRQAQALLGQVRPDVVLLDYLLPDGSGLDLLSSYTCELPCPFLVLTSHGGEDIAAEAIKAGASDYVVKSAEALTSLPQMVERVLKEWQQIRTIRETREALRLSEEKYRRLFVHLGEAVSINEILLDDKGNPCDWRILDLNPACRRMLQIGESLSKPASEIYGVEFNLNPVLEAYAKLVGGADSVLLDLCFPHACLRCRATLFLVADGQFATLIHSPHP